MGVPQKYRKGEAVWLSVCGRDRLQPTLGRRTYRPMDGRQTNIKERAEPSTGQLQALHCDGKGTPDRDGGRSAAWTVSS